MNLLTKLLDCVAAHFPLNIKWHSGHESDHYHPLDEREEYEPLSLFD